MLIREYRLTADKDFERLYKSGKNHNGRGLGVKICPNGMGVSRFAFIVGTKVSKNAVERNLLKRRLREVIRKLLATSVVGLDIAVVARSEALKMTFQELQNSANELLRRAGVLTGRL